MPRHGISSDGHKLQCAGHSGQDLMALALTAGVKGHMGAGLKKRTPLSAGSLAQSGRLLLNINTQARSSFGRCSREFGGKPSTAFTGPFRLSLAAPKLQLAPASSSSLSLSLLASPSFFWAWGEVLPLQAWQGDAWRAFSERPRNRAAEQAALACGHVNMIKFNRIHNQIQSMPADRLG